eukprot:m.918095 g.918095  ORF g.918095 m.918095 type:complete len:4523 (+) comp60173_c0_seq1:4307-17875(+)
MNTNQLTLSFSEAILASSVDARQLTVQNAVTRTAGRTLTGGNVQVSSNCETIAIQLLAADVNALTVLDQAIATGTANTYLVMASLFATDYPANAVVAIVDGSARRASSYVADGVAPQLVGFQINMNTRVLTLTFSEVVRASSGRADGGIVLQNSATSSASLLTQHMPTGGSVTSGDGTTLVLSLSSADCNAIGTKAGLLRAQGSAFVWINSSVVLDMAGNAVVEMPSSQAAMQASAFVADTTAPTVVRFSVDKNVPSVTIFFSETVSVSSFNPGAFVLQSSASVMPALSYTLVASSTTSAVFRSADWPAASPQPCSAVSNVQPCVPDNGQTYTGVRVQLAKVDFDALCLLDNIAKTAGNTYLSAGTSLVSDVSNNAVVAVTAAAAIQAVSVTADSTAPTLMSLTVNMDSGVVALSFSEVVRASTFSVVAIRLQSAAQIATPATQSVTLTGAAQASSSNGLTVIFTMTRADMNLIEQRAGVVDATTHVVLQAGVVQDMTGNQASAIANGSGLQAQSVVLDQTAPTFTSFDLNMNTGTLTLRFVETVKVSTLAVQHIQLQSASAVVAGTLTFSLHSGVSSSASASGTTIAVTLGASDLNAIKALPGLATGSSNTFLSLGTQTIQDMHSNNLVAVAASAGVQVTTFVQDSSAPTLSAFSVSLNTNSVLLTFSETVNASSFAPTTLIAQSSASLPTASVQLTSTQFVAVDSLTIRLALSDFDLNALKVSAGLFKSRATTFVAFANLVSDFASNVAISRATSDALQAQSFEVDSVRPELVSFSFDWVHERADLTFTEAVAISSCDPSAVTFSNGCAAPSDSCSFSLTGGACSLLASHVVRLGLHNSDVNQIKSRVGLCRSQSTCLISFRSTFVADLTQNAIRAIDFASALQAAAFQADNLPVTLREFSLNMNDGTVLLSFSETIPPASFSALRLLLQDAQTLSTSLVVTTTASAQSVYVPSACSGSLPSDTCRRCSQCAGEQFELVSCAVAHDTTCQACSVCGAGNYTAEFCSRTRDTVCQACGTNCLSCSGPGSSCKRCGGGSLLHAGNCVSGCPAGFFAGVDLNSDPVCVPCSSSCASCSGPSASECTSCPPTRIAAAGSCLNACTSRWFSDLSSRTCQQCSGTCFDCLDASDSSCLSCPVGRLLDGMTCVISCPTGKYPSGGACLACPHDCAACTSASACTSCRNGAVLSSSACLASCQSGSFATGLSSSTGRACTSCSACAGGSVQLDVCRASRDTVCSALPQTAVSFVLSHSDLNSLKRIPPLATSVLKTYASFDEHLAADMFLNAITSVFSSQALSASAFYPDVTSPTLVSFDVDMNYGSLRLSFSEVVNSNSLVVSRLALVDSVQSASAPFIFSSLQFSLAFDDAFTLLIPLSELNRLKKVVSIASSSSNTYLTMLSTAVVDMNLNNLVAIPLSAAKRVSLFTPDTTAPVLLGFDLNLNANTLTLSFSETVMSSSFSASGLSLVSSRLVSALEVTLTGGLVSTNDAVVTVTLAQRDVASLNLAVGLCDSALDTFLRADSSAFTDMVGIPLVPIDLAHALVVSAFVKDSTSPALVSFALDLDLAVLTLSFNEIVNSSSFDVRQVTLQSRTSLAAGVSYALTGQAGLHSLGYDVVVDLTYVDQYAIKSMRGLAKLQSSTWLSFTTAALKDMAQNSVIAVSNTAAAAASAYTRDATAPTILWYDLDLATENVNILFSEPIDLLLVDFTRLAMVAPAAAASVALTGGSVLNAQDVGINLLFKLSAADVISLKLHTAVAENAPSSVLSVSAGAFVDMSQPGNAISPAAQAVRNFGPDTVSPRLLQAHVDMDLGRITLNFDEPIAAASLQATAVTLQAAAQAGVGVNTLTLSGVINPQTANSLQVTLSLLTTDLDLIKERPPLCAAQQSCFIAFTSAFARDMNSNAVQAIQASSAFAIQSFVRDSTRPALIAFSIDLTQERLMLTFAEAVNVTSFDLTALVLQSSSAATVSSQVGLTSGSVLTTQAIFPTVTLQLAFADLNELKGRGICLSSAACWLTHTSALASDMVGLAALPRVNSLSALAVGSFVGDLTPPTIVSSSLDMNTGTLGIRFSETIPLASVRITQLTLQSTAARSGSTQFYGLTASTTNVVLSSRVDLVISLSSEDLNQIKLRIGLGKSITSSFLVATSTSAMDASGNALIALSTSSALQVSLYTGDVTSPVLTGFSLDLHAEVLALSFSEVVSAASLQVSALLFQIAVNDSSTSYALQSGTWPSFMDGSVISVTLAVTDVNAIKARVGLAMAADSTFLSVSQLLIVDMQGNRVVPVLSQAALAVSTYVVDRVAPRLVSFDLDMNLEQIVLTFSETLASSQISVTELTLQDTATSGGLSFKLTSGTISAGRNTRFVVSLARADVNVLKASPPLATSRPTTFVSFAQSFAADLQLNSVEPKASSAALPASSFTQDVTAPSLVRSELDMNVGTLVLSFSEIINASSIDPTRLRLQDTVPTATTSLQLSSSVTWQHGYFSLVTLTLPASDLNALKRLSKANFVISRATSYLSFTSALLTDMNGNQIVATASTQARLVDAFRADSTAPTLLSFNWNNALGTIALSFSETVDRATLSVTALVLHGNGQTYTLTDGSCSDTDGLQLSITLTSGDHNALKARRICVAQSACFLELSSGLVKDMAGTAITPILAGNSLQVSGFVADGVAPQLGQFDQMDMNAGTIRLVFSETISMTSVTPAQLRLTQSAGVNSPVSYTLTGGSVLSVDGPVVLIRLLTADLNQIKLRLTLCTRDTDCAVRFTTQFASDATGNAVVATAAGAFRQSDFPTNFIADTTPPALAGSVLNMQTGRLFLTFDEVVPVISFFPLVIELRNTFANPTERLTVGAAAPGTRVTTTNGDVIEYALSSADVLALKAFVTLAKSASDTYINIINSAAGALVLDFSSNGFVPFDPAFSVGVSSYTQDSTRPTLASFAGFDRNTGTLRLSFDEPVLLTTATLTAITLQNKQDGSTLTRPLSSGSTAAYVDSGKLQVNVVVSPQDLLAIKASNLLVKTPSTTFVALSSSAFTDTSGNALVAVPTTSAMPVLSAGFVSDDNTPPRLSNFTLDMNTGVLTLVFDTVVLVSTLQADKITLQSHSTLQSPFYKLTGGTTGSSDGYEIALQLSVADMNELKKLVGLATATSNTFISMTSETIKSVPGTPMIAVVSDSARQASAFTPDQGRPTLVAFALDLTLKTITFTFSETVNVSSFNPSSVTVQDLPSSSSLVGEPHGFLKNEWALTGGVVPSAYSTTFTLSLLKADFDAIRMHATLAVDLASTYLRLAADGIFDMRGLGVAAMADGQAIRAAAYVSDSVRPTLVSFTLNMNSGVLTLSFDEVVRATATSVTGLTLQNRVSAATATLTLTSGTVSALNALTVTVTLSQTDLNALNAFGTLAQDRASTFLSIAAHSAADMQGNTILATSATQAVTFVADGTAPVLVSFALNMNSGRLSLTFSETVAFASLQPSSFALQNRAALASAKAQQALQSSTVTVNANSPVLTVVLLTSEFNLLKRIPDLASASTNTFLSVLVGGVTDMFGNANVAVPASAALSASMVVLDSTAPSLLGFSLDMNLAVLQFTFAEPILASSVVSSSVSLQSRASAAPVAYTLQASTVLTGVDLCVNPGCSYPLIWNAQACCCSLPANPSSGPFWSSGSYAGNDNAFCGAVPASPYSASVVGVRIASSDLNEIKRLRLGLTSNTFLAFSGRFATDTTGNNVTDISTSGALAAASVAQDTTAPALVSFALNMNTAKLLLSFSETVRVSSLLLSGITLQSTAIRGAPTTFFTLTGDQFDQAVDRTSIEITLTVANMNSIKTLRTLATDITSTYLVLAAGTVEDMYANGVSAILSSSALQAGSYIVDSTAPTLTSFSLDMTVSGVLSLTFSESVASASLTVGDLTLQTDADRATAAFSRSLTGGVVSVADTPVVTITLTKSDLDAIRLDYPLASSLATSFISFSSAFVKDTFGNNVIAVASSTAKQAAVFTADSTRPTLVLFNLNMNTGALELSFSEPVRASSFVVTALVLQEASSSASGATYRLTAASSHSTSNSLVIVVQLGVVDLNNVKSLAPLAASSSKSWLAVDAAGFADMNGLSSLAIPSAAARQVSQHVVDSSAPSVTFFGLNMNSGAVVLEFDEPVVASSFVVANMIIFSNQLSHSIQAGSVTQIAQLRLQIVMSVSDLDQLKLIDGLARSQATARLRLLANSVQDRAVSANSNVEQSVSCALFVADNTSPHVTNFVVDMTTGVLTINFDEPIRASSAQVASLTVQGVATVGSASDAYTLTTATTSQVNGRQLLVTINQSDINAILALPKILQDLQSSYLQLSSAFIQDMAGNAIAPILASAGLQALSFSQDSSAPRLLAFDLNMNGATGILVLTFSETVDAATLVKSGIVLRASSASDASGSYQLTGGSVTSRPHSDILVLELTASDLDGLKLKRIGLRRETAWLTFDSAAVKNVFSVAVDPVTNGVNSLGVSNFVPDSTRPAIQSFNFDMDQGTLSLSFSEPVSAQTLQAIMLKLQNRQAKP